MGKKRPSIARDIATGIAIAGVAVAVFFFVRMFLSGDDPQANKTSAKGSEIATITLDLPSKLRVELWIDGNKRATIGANQEIPVTAGERKVRLVAPTGDECEQTVSLPAGKLTKIQCPLAPPKVQASPPPPAPSDPAVKPSDDKPEAVDPPVATKADPGGDAIKVKPAKPDAGVPSVTPADGDDTARPAPNAKGYVQVFGTPVAKILVDKKDTGLTTPITGKKLELAPGKHHITYVIGNNKFSYLIDVKPGQTTTVTKNHVSP